MVDLPKDIQREYGSDDYPEKVEIRGYKPRLSVHAGQIKKALETLNNAEKPIFLVGGGVNISHAHSEMLKLAERTGVPVITTIMGKGAIPATHDLYIGNIGIHGSYAANTAISNCDVLFSIGTRFNDRITGKTGHFAAHATIIHIDIDSSSISRNIAVDIPIVADAKMAISALLKKVQKLDTGQWLEQIKQWKSQYPIFIFDNAIIATDVGQNQLWTTQFLELSEKKQMLTSGGLGTMGYGFPAAIGAKIGNPSKDVIVISGDGGIQMNIQEMATAVCYELPITICILNNGYLGNVRQWQEMFFDRRYSSTCMRYRKSCPNSCNSPTECCPEYTPDFIKLEESYGAIGIRITKESEIKAALETAKNTLKVPTVIEFIIEPEENVMPIVPPGNALDEMILEGEGNGI